MRWSERSESRPGDGGLPGRAHPGSGPIRAAIAASTSPGLGNRPLLFFEKTPVPSRVTSKVPLEPFTSSAAIPNFSLSDAARPTARGL